METEDLPGALDAYGWSDRVLALFRDAAQPGVVPGRVVRVEKGHAVVVDATGAERLLPAPAAPAVGDWVTLSSERLESILPRWSALSRQDPAGGVQVLAADIDLVLITAPADRLSPARVERELALAWDSGAVPLVVLTKADVAAPGLAEELRRRLAGTDVLEVSAVAGTGVGDVAEELRPNRTAVLLGPSGAGKSTLTNALLGAERLAVGAVRDVDHRGRHTTSTRQLVTLPGGGVLIDTPGLRSLALATAGGVPPAFPEIAALAAGCRFADCRHDIEPGCAVVAAVASGELDPARLASYRKLDREAAAEARRHDPLLRKAELGEWKARMKEARAIARRKQR